MFNLAIDSKLRGCDVVAIRVEDVAAGGCTADRATVRQKNPGGPSDWIERTDPPGHRARGLIKLGKIDSGIEALNLPGSFTVKIDLIKKQPL
jgi:hypothetical protein